MKKSAAVRLTLVSALAAGAAACADDRPQQTMRGWCDPESPEVCDDQPRAGFVPIFFPIYHRGIYYDNRGIGRTGPGGAVVRGAPRPSVSRGGFGRTGSGRGGRGGGG
ncbi:MAG TPA: hypothetical protein VGB66_11640 [Longimicrobium sp.]